MAQADDPIAAGTTPDTTAVHSGADRRRYRLAAYSSLANVVSKGLSLLVLYVSVPLTISYLGTERFGIWMTLASFIGFLGFLDFGISSGLVSRVASLAAQEKHDRLAEFISNALVLLAGLGLLVGVGLFVVARYAPIERIFSGGSQNAAEIHRAASTLAILIGVSLPLVGLQRIFAGLQRAFLYHLLMATGSLVSLLTLIVLARQKAGIDGLLLATYGVQILSAAPLLGLLAARGLIGRVHRRQFRADAKDLLHRGTLFFVLSIGGAVAWESDLLILSNTAGAGAVAVYAVAVRMFQLVEIPLQMANAPLWSAYSDAYASGSAGFLKRTLRRSFFVTLGAAVLGTALLVLLQRPIIHVWIKNAVEIPLMLALAMGLWSTIRASGNAFAMYLNGIHLLRPQVVLVCVFCLLALPLKIWWASNWSAGGIVFASIVSYVICVAVPYLTIYRRAWSRPLTRA